MNTQVDGWRLADQADQPALRALLVPREVHATALSEKLRTPAPFRNDRDRILVYPAGRRGLDAVLFLSSSGCAMPLVDDGLEPDRVQGMMSSLCKSPLVQAFRPASCVGLEATIHDLEQAAGWHPALSVRYDAMSLDEADYCTREPGSSYRGPVAGGLALPALAIRTAGPDDLEALLPAARAYEMEEVETPMHPFNEAVCRANQARALARYRVRILETEGMIVARAQTNAIGYGREQLGGIIVIRHLRGRGFGRYVVTDLVESILADGKGLSLFVKKGNNPARCLYETLGFKYSGDFRVDYFK